jgi:hypothetical protein
MQKRNPYVPNSNRTSFLSFLFALVIKIQRGITR